MMIHNKTGITFANRKQAKQIMGCLRYKMAAENGEFTYLNQEGNKVSGKNN